MSESSTGKDTSSAALPPRAPRTVVRIITIELEGDACAVSMSLGTILAHLLRDDRQPEPEEPEPEEPEGDGR